MKDKWEWLVKKPLRLTGSAALIAFLTVVVMAALDSEGLTVWVLGGTGATVWALVLAVAIWHATASDTSDLISEVDNLKKEITRLFDRPAVTSTAAGHVIEPNPPEGAPLYQAMMGTSLLPEPVLNGFESRTGRSRSHLLGGKKAYEDASDDVPWVLFETGGQRWFVSASGSLVTQVH